MRLSDLAFEVLNTRFPMLSLLNTQNQYSNQDVSRGILATYISNQEANPAPPNVADLFSRYPMLSVLGDGIHLNKGSLDIMLAYIATQDALRSSDTATIPV